jgi:hypothetical protein
MIVRISRYTLILVAVLVMSIYLPDLYWLFFDVKTHSPYVSFSPVDSVFIMYRRGDDGLEFTDVKGNTYNRDEYEEKLPFFYYMQLISDGRMPETIHGIQLDVNEIKRNRNMHRIKSYQLDQPQIPLYPLLESESGRVRLEFPEEYFRINNERMEFINSVSRNVDKDLTESFTQALKETGFEFPSKAVYINPTTLKPFDEGCFVVDGKDDLYHIKKAKGEPVVRATGFPKDIAIRSIMVAENNLKEYYGLVVSENDRLFFLTYDNYTPVELPTKGCYDSHYSNVIIMTDLFFRQVTIQKDDGIDVFVTDREYNLLDEYHESWDTRDEYFQGKVAKAIFPFTLTLHDGSSTFVGLFSTWNFPLALIGNVIALILFMVFLKKEERDYKTAIPEIILVAVTGVYGLIACLVYIYVPLWRPEKNET